MRHLAVVCLFAGSIAGARTACAQGPPPPIPRFVIDLHPAVAMFPNDLQQLSDSRGLTLSELPGWGIGGQVGAHVYLFKWKAMTVGVGGEAVIARASSTPSAAALAAAAAATPPTPAPVPVSERLAGISPQLSFNFGTGHGWSYVSGGIGRSQLSLHPTAESPGFADTEVLLTLNGGAGARWFIKPHLAFSFDVRFYDVRPGSTFQPGSPYVPVLIIGAGISVK
jgi:hypothetical protein